MVANCLGLSLVRGYVEIWTLKSGWSVVPGGAVAVRMKQEPVMGLGHEPTSTWNVPLTVPWPSLGNGLPY